MPFPLKYQFHLLEIRACELSPHSQKQLTSPTFAGVSSRGGGGETQDSRRRRTAMENLLAWLISFLLNMALMGNILFQLICLADLESDYINPYDSSMRINQVVVPEYITQGIICCVQLLSGHWIMFLLYLPNLCYNVKRYNERSHLMDITEIFNQIPREKKVRCCKLGYMVFMVAISIGWMIASIID